MILNSRQEQGLVNQG